jgi:nucleotide-binding universal stress UspA family protein
VLYPTRILLATDGSPESRCATETAVGLAVATDSELHVAHAISTAPPTPYPHASAGQRWELVLLDEKAREVEKMGRTVAGTHYGEGDPVEEILWIAEELGVGLIVTGGRAPGRPGPFWFRSYPMRRFRRAGCPVLIVRGGRGPRGEQPGGTDA